jgi:hypothetical protein
MQKENSSSKITPARSAITAQVLKNARKIVAAPEAGHPKSLRRWAWAALKSARGQSISQSGLNRLCGRDTPTRRDVA